MMPGNPKKFESDGKLDYLKVLVALKEIPFGVGKKLLIDFLGGNIKNKSIKNNRIAGLDSFGSLKLKEEKIEATIENLIGNSLIEITRARDNSFVKTLKLTARGRQEIFKPKLYANKINHDLINRRSEITENDKLIFKELDFFLNGFNEHQKKAIISGKKEILCIAGAGSGKTTVLIKRIEFLIKYRGVAPKKILAITFTRKAKQEMQERLMSLKIETNVETFNSFSEKILQKYGQLIYQRQVRMMNYANKIMIILSALNKLGLTMENVVDKYFSPSQKRNKTHEELSNIFMNDCFSVLDFFKAKNQELYDFSGEVELKEKQTARMIYEICKYIEDYMKLYGFRDYTDQVLDTIKFFKENKELIPKFEHILVDEYQDVNAMQIKLLDLLKLENIFAVGDPRQSIFGWRGSDIKYILSFPKKYPDCEIITLTKNYRSTKHIVDFMNHAIKELSLPDIEPNIYGEKEIKIYNFAGESEEFEFIINKILGSDIEREEIFILARTNSQLAEISLLLKQKLIPHVVKADEINKPVFAKQGEVTLATIHSIKGLEAKMVFVVGCTEINFPCKGSDHPIIEMIKLENYDKEEEEKRLFYVAISRAKEKLYLTYSGKKPTYFINNEMLKIAEIENLESQKSLF